MATLTGRAKSALVVIDVQRGVVAQAWERDAVVAQVARAVDQARAAGVAVVWVQHHDAQLERGSAAWEFVDELVPAAGEPIIEKTFGDSFEGTTLERYLAELEVGRIIVVGAQSDQCIRSTIHGAFVRGYDVTLVADAHTTEDLSAWGAPPPGQVVAHTNLYWGFQEAPGRTAVVAPLAAVDFATT